MIYDLRKDFDREKFKTRSNFLLEKQRVVELTEKTARTLKQNNYTYLILSVFALEYGEPVEYIKQEYFKRLVNPEIFIEKKIDKFLGEIEVLKSSADVSKEDMCTAIERFKNWAAKECGIRLPDAFTFDERVELERMIQQNRHFL